MKLLARGFALMRRLGITHTVACKSVFYVVLQGANNHNFQVVHRELTNNGTNTKHIIVQKKKRS